MPPTLTAISLGSKATRASAMALQCGDEERDLAARGGVTRPASVCGAARAVRGRAPSLASGMTLRLVSPDEDAVSNKMMPRVMVAQAQTGPRAALLISRVELEARKAGHAQG